MSSEAGETTAQINKRWDAEELPAVLRRLNTEPGTTLYRPTKLDRFYVRDARGDIGGGSLSRATVMRLARTGVLVRIGIDHYRPADFSLTAEDPS